MLKPAAASAILALALASGFAADPPATVPGGSYTFKEERLGDYAGDADRQPSRDGRQFAWALRRDHKEVLLVNGKEGPSAPQIANIQWSRDGKRYACALLGPRKTIFVDGKELDTFNDADESTFHFSPDGTSYAFIARDPRVGGREPPPFLVVDGKRSPVLLKNFASQAVISPDCARVAYVAFAGGPGAGGSSKMCVTVDDKPGPVFRSIAQSSLVISPDSKHVACIAENDQGKQVVVIDGVGGPEYDEIVKDSFWFSPDGARSVYVGLKNSKQCLVVDGKEDGVYEAITAPAFSEGGKAFVYVGYTDDKKTIVLNGKPLQTYNNLGEIIFSRDQKHVLCLAQRDNKQFRMVDGKEVALNDTLSGDLHIAGWPGPERVPEIKQVSAKQTVKIDDFTSAEYDEIPLISYSADAKHWFAAVIKDQKQLLLLDGKATPAADEIKSAVFSPDGKHVAYIARTDRRLRVYVDGSAGPEFDETLLFNGAELTFDADGSLDFNAVKQKAVYRIHCAPAGK